MQLDFSNSSFQKSSAVSLIEKSDHRVPSSIQITALCTSCLMILMGQANAWYANKPESSLIEDIKRKIAIAVLLLSPNIAVIGGGLIVIALWQAKKAALAEVILIISLGGVLMLIYSICYCSKRRSKKSIFKTNLADK